MKNNKSEILPKKGVLFQKTNKLSQNKTNSICNALQSICNGVVNCNLVPAANENETNEYGVCENGGIFAANATAENWYLIAPFGDFTHSVGIQRFDEIAANEVVKSFNSRWNKIKRLVGCGTTIPLLRGHPDVGDDGRPGISSRHLDQTVYGKVEELKCASNGLMAKIKWLPEFNNLPKGLRFSPFWLMKTISEGIHRPVFIRSIGLTHNPNIPMTSAANEISENKQKENKMLKSILIKLGYSEEEAQKTIDNQDGALSEETVLAKITELTNSIDSAKAEADKAKEAQTSAETKLTEVQESAANERSSFAKLIINAAIKDGKLTEADRANKMKTLLDASDFVAAANEINDLEKKVETTSETDDIKKPDAKASAKKAFNELVEKYQSDGLPRVEATLRAKKEMPEQYKLAFES